VWRSLASCRFPPKNTSSTTPCAHLFSSFPRMAEEPDSSKLLYVYHGAIEDKEFEFSFDVPVPADPTHFSSALHAAVTAAVEEASSAILDSVQPLMCAGCGAKEAIRLQHNLMYFDEVVPRRVEDLPQPLCGAARCARDAAEAVKRDLQAAARLLGKDKPSAALAKTKNLSACLACGTVTEKLMQCSRCKVARYCSGSCQKSHWPEHKGQCIPLTTAASN
jgi:hypothetical protein